MRVIDIKNITRIRAVVDQRTTAVAINPNAQINGQRRIDDFTIGTFQRVGKHVLRTGWECCCVWRIGVGAVVIDQQRAVLTCNGNAAFSDPGVAVINDQRIGAVTRLRIYSGVN